jgi:putative peptide zinc metalloprotease protein
VISLADSLVSASSRPLAIHRRRDLSAKRQNYLGTAYWIVKEPVGLNYFRFQEEEYAILNMLDGKTSLDDMKDRYEDEFPPGKITVEEIARFVGNLYQSGLLVADVPGQGDQLKRQRSEKRKKQLIGQWTNILALRFKGIDPDRLLSWMYPYVSWFFTRAALIVCCLMGLAALLLVGVQWEIFQSKLPSFHEFFASENWIWLMLTLGVSKVLHEFGHGLSCKHFGGECHEIGVMILVLTPCLYCNVSDSWMLPNKWHRAAIGAAGMYVEVVIASVCTFVWWFTEPGLLNQVCLSVMFVSSVSTILFNGNPLLRYDGYYILADIMEVPNMRQKATSILNRKLGAWCLGLEEPDDPFLPQRNQWAFGLYTVAAVCYRWFVLIMILTFLYEVFEPYGLQIIGQVIMLGSLYSLIVMPFWKLYKYFAVPGRLHQVKKPRLYATLGVIAAIIGFICFVKLPYSVVCPMEIQVHKGEHVNIEVPGTLKKVYVKPLQEVEEGQILAELENLQAEQELYQLHGEVKATAARIAALRLQKLLSGADGRKAANELRQAEESLESLTERRDQKEQDIERLTLRAPRAGTVIPSELVSGKPSGDGLLPTWSGTPFDPENQGAYLQLSQTFCLIGDPAKMEAVLVVDQLDRPFVAQGQAVDLKLDCRAGEIIEGQKLANIAAEHMKYSPGRLSTRAGYDVLTETDPQTGRDKPMNPSYVASVLLDDPDGKLQVGLRGYAEIHASSRTLGNRIYRFIAETFSFRF